MGRGSFLRLIFIGAILAVGLAAFASPVRDLLTPEGLAGLSGRLTALVASQPLPSFAAFVLVCVVASTLCFPAAPLLGVSAGALFGFWTGLAALELGFATGSTLCFLASRHLFRAPVEARLGRRLERIDRGFERHGPAFLLALRINPFVPYWLVNLAIGVTRMRTLIYVPLTALGLLPALAVYATAGSRLAAAGSAGELFSPAVLATLFLLSLVPVVADRLRIRRAERRDELR